MYFILYPEKDATIYERYPTKNTGMDAVLEVGKEIVTSGSINYNYATRAILRFDLTPWHDLIYNGEVGINPSSIPGLSGDMRLKVKSCFPPTRLPASYSIEAWPLYVPDAGVWENGTGLIDEVPMTQRGVNWTEYQSGSAWLTGSFPLFNTASWTTNPGGGNMYTHDIYGQQITQVFSTESADINMNIYGPFIVLSGYPYDYSYPINYGVLLKLSDVDERSDKPIDTLRYFSAETNTIYPPTLHWQFLHHAYTSASSVLAEEGNISLTIKNFQREYHANDKVKFELSIRDKFPNRTFSTSSAYLIQKRLPEDSYYSIRDAYSDEVIVPYCNGTMLDCNQGVTTFKHWMSNLMPERWYRIVFRVHWDYIQSTEQYFKEYDNDLIFKVVR